MANSNDWQLGDRVFRNQLTRRDFLYLAGICSVTPALSNCAVNPVTGENQFMLMSKDQEIAIDKRSSPQQFSGDYGVIQDSSLNSYLSSVGVALARKTHRADMPYNFQVVNANYANAYAFPGGSIAVTRGILVNLNNEAELAGLLGHELGHVNARHTASRMSKGTLLNLGLSLGMIAASGTKLQGLAGQLGQLGGAALLAHYSRNDERQADALGMEYMVKSDYNPQGMVGLMALLRSMSRHNPSAIQTMFATHPMSDERFATATQTADGRWASAKNMPVNRERFMDQTARLRRKKSAIKAMEQAEQAIAKKNFQAAQNAINQFRRQAPNDYAGLLIRGKYHYAQEQYQQAKPLFKKASQVYPNEAQAHHLLGLSQLATRNPQAALNQFNQFERLLPGNPNTTFLQGLSLEYMQQKQAAANRYAQFLQKVKRGGQAQHAYQRLVEWGYVSPQS